MDTHVKMQRANNPAPARFYRTVFKETTPQQRYSPQSRKWGTTHRGGKYVVTVIVGEAWVYQTNWLVFFLIRCGNPPVWTCTPGIRTPAQLHTERP